MRKHWIYVSIIWQFFQLRARFSDLVKNSNIYIKKIYWAKSNFPSKWGFKSDETENKHSFASYVGIFIFYHTLIVIFVIS